MITSAGGKLPPLPVAGAGEAEDGAAARSLHGGIEVAAAGHPANPKRQGHTAAGFSTDHKRGRDDGAQARLVDEGGGHLPEPTGLAGHPLEERNLALRLGQQASKSLEVSTGDRGQGSGDAGHGREGTEETRHIAHAGGDGSARGFIGGAGHCGGEALRQAGRLRCDIARCLEARAQSAGGAGDCGGEEGGGGFRELRNESRLLVYGAHQTRVDQIAVGERRASGGLRGLVGAKDDAAFRGAGRALQGELNRVALY